MLSLTVPADPAGAPHLAARPSHTRLAEHAAEAARQLRQLPEHDRAAALPVAGLARASVLQRGLLACLPLSVEAAVLGVEHPDGAEVRLNMIQQRNECGCGGVGANGDGIGRRRRQASGLTFSLIR